MKFTARQVTTMVVAIAFAAALVPVAAFAVGTAVNIVDATSGTKARVNASGQLWTVMIDPATGARNKVDPGGRLLVGDGSAALTIDGAVSQTAPAKPLSATGSIFSGQSVHHTWGAGRTAVSDLILSQTNTEGVRVAVAVKLYADGGAGNCTTTTGSPVADLGFFELMHNATPLVVNLTTPVVGASSDVVCLRLSAPVGTNLLVRYTVSGFDV